jgi:hypothetical protein
MKTIGNTIERAVQLTRDCKSFMFGWTRPQGRLERRRRGLVRAQIGIGRMLNFDASACRLRCTPSAGVGPGTVMAIVRYPAEFALVDDAVSFRLNGRHAKCCHSANLHEAWQLALA